jgi:hypothetical protein
MSDRTHDELEARLSVAFRASGLPAAPITLERALERIPDATPRAARGHGWSTLGVLGLAAVLGAAGLIAIVGGGRGPSIPVPSDRPSGAPLTRLVYAIQWTADVPSTDATRADIVRVLESRLVGSPAAGSAVTVEGSDRVVVELASGVDAGPIRSLVGHRGLVAFVPLGSNPAEVGDVIDERQFPALFHGTAVREPVLSTNQSGEPALSFTLSEPAASQFADYTAAHIGDSFAITVDGVVASAPRIMSPIPRGDVEIAAGPDGDVSALRELFAILRSGPLPVDLVDPQRPDSTAAPTTSASTPAATASTEITCAEPLGLPDELSCEDGIAAALAALPKDHRPISRITFVHECQDVGFTNAAFTTADCLVQAFGRIGFEFVGGARLTIELSGGGYPRVLHSPIASDPPILVPIDPGGPLATCASPRGEPTAVTIRIAEDGEVSAVELSGAVKNVIFQTGFQVILDPVRLVVHGRPGQAFGMPIMFHDGEVLTVNRVTNQEPSDFWPTCFAPDGSVVVIDASGPRA